MKVAHISAYTGGGAGIAAYRLHKGLLKSNMLESVFVQKGIVENNQNNVYQCLPSYPLFYRIKKKFRLTEDDYFTKKIEKAEHNYEIVSIPLTPFRIENLDTVKQADIVHLHWVADFLNYPSFFKMIKQPIVWTLHDLNPFMGIFHYRDDKDRNFSSLGLIEQQALAIKKKAIGLRENITIVTPSDWLKDLSEKSNLFMPYKHHVISYGIDFNLYPKLDQLSCKAGLGVDPLKPTLLFISHNIEVKRKGFDLLQNAIKRMDNNNFNLISVGGKKIEIKMGIKHLHFDYIKNIQELNKIYTAADLTILPSREDNLPNVILESFANGTPVLSFANGGMKEHITTGINGILINNEINHENLKQKITDFINKNYDFDRNQIRQYALDHFSEQQQINAYIKLYSQILNH